jgi:phosphoglycolate phosphatase
MKYTHVIWDFNGTVLRDMEPGIRATNQMLQERGLPPLRDLSHYRALFGFPVQDYYRRLGLDLEKEDYHTVLAPLWVSLYNKYSKDAPLYEGVAPLCRALKAQGVHCSILSASERDMMCKQLQQRGASELFDEIWGADSIHAVGKSALAQAWCRAHPGARAVLLGDTTHDFEVARQMGVDCILIAAGHHGRDRLAACGVPVVNDLSEVLALLQ